MSLTYANIIHNNAAESGDILISGQSVGNFKGLTFPFGAPELKETSDISSQLGKRVEVWRTKENFEASCMLQDWDFNFFDSIGLFNTVTTIVKVRDELVSRLPSFPVVFKLGKMIDAVTTAVTGETITLSTTDKVSTFTLAHGRIVPGTISFGDGVETVTDDDFSVLTGSAAGSGYVNVNDGKGKFTWAATPGAVTNGAYSYYSDYQLQLKFYKAKIVRDGNIAYDTEGGGGFYLPVRILACVTSSGYSTELEKVASA